jgi:hypothetical protein
LIGLIGASIVFISKGIETSAKGVAFAILAIIYTLIGWFGIYTGMPTFAWPLFGVFGFLTFIWWVVSCVVAGIMNDGERWNHANWFPIAYIIVIIILLIANSGMFNSGRYAGLIGTIQDKTQKHWSQDVQPLDPTHIRLVPKELAVSLAKTTLGDNGATLGSQFPLDEEHATLQKINNDYWYLIPLDYKSWTVWTNASFVPGYVKVSATDPYAKPNLITGKKMKYTPNAFFGDNLERRLYWKYNNKVLIDYSFEEDDNGKAFWVVTVCHPTIGFWGLEVDGVVIFDPETGQDEFASKEEIEKNAKYAWVDRVMPVELVEAYINYWGNYKGGWWNQFWTHINLLESETPTLNYSADGRCVIVSPITSNNEKDEAMTGLMYTDARTGSFIYYATSGGATEQSVIDAVNSAVSFKKWHASPQIVYENVYGKLSALVPILGENGNYQGLAVVENENKRVGIGANPQEALVEFQKLLMSSGGQITTENSKDVLEFTGKITRIGWDISGSSSGKQYYFYFAEFKNSFMVSSSLQSELSLTQPGDVVFIRYIASDQASVPIMKFRNVTLNLQGSKNEQNVNSQMANRKDEAQVKADVKDFKESVKEMSDEEVKKLLEQKKKEKK